MRYVAVIVVCTIDGVAVGRGAEVDVSKGGLGVASSLMGFDVLEHEIDAARTLWERCLAASCLLLPGAAYAIVRLQHGALDSRAHISVRGSHANASQQGLALTAAPVVAICIPRFDALRAPAAQRRCHQRR